MRATDGGHPNRENVKKEEKKVFCKREKKNFLSFTGFCCWFLDRTFEVDGKHAGF